MSNTIIFGNPDLTNPMVDSFSAKKLATLSGLSLHMVNYLCRSGILAASISSQGRGTARRFSFSDLIFARAVAKLLNAGASVLALKRALSTLRNKLHNASPATLIGKRVAIVGQKVYFLDNQASPIDLTACGQLSFHFVLDAPMIRPTPVPTTSRKQKRA